MDTPLPGTANYRQIVCNPILLAYANNSVMDAMPRPLKCRRIFQNPEYKYFKPQGIPLTELDEINLTLDELETIRLADQQGLYQEDAANKMNISRQTFGNILNSAHKKIADFLIEGKALCIKGGIVEMRNRHFLCKDCKHEWVFPCGTGRPQQCPHCNSMNIYRSTRVPGRGKTGKDGLGAPRDKCERRHV